MIHTGRSIYYLFFWGGGDGGEGVGQLLKKNWMKWIFLTTIIMGNKSGDTLGSKIVLETFTHFPPSPPKNFDFFYF